MDTEIYITRILFFKSDCTTVNFQSNGIIT